PRTSCAAKNSPTLNSLIPRAGSASVIDREGDYHSCMFSRYAVVLAALTLPAQDRPRIFRITPVRPISELRPEALAAQPPHESGDFRPSDLIDLATLDARIKFDIRYATRDNFLSTAVYPAARALLQRPAAEALRRAHRALLEQGYGVLVFDAYRPW